MAVERNLDPAPPCAIPHNSQDPPPPLRLATLLPMTNAPKSSSMTADARSAASWDRLHSSIIHTVRCIKSASLVLRADALPPPLALTPLASFPSPFQNGHQAARGKSGGSAGHDGGGNEGRHCPRDDDRGGTIVGQRLPGGTNANARAAIDDKGEGSGG
jgi:hypothetical protein